MDIFADTTSFFVQVEKNMDVYDLAHVRVGKVKHIYLPDVSDDLDVEHFPYQLEANGVPFEVAVRLLRNGFLAVHAGLLAKDRIVLQEEIAVVANGNVYLNVTEDELITI